MLVVDGDAVVRKLLTEALRADGHDVSAVKEGDGAIDAAARQPMDVASESAFAPESTTSVGRLAAAMPGTPVIATAGGCVGCGGDPAGARPGGRAAGVLTKPFRLSALAAAVAGALTRRV